MQELLASGQSQGSSPPPLSLLDRAISHLTGGGADGVTGGPVLANGAGEVSGSFSLASLTLGSRVTFEVAQGVNLTIPSPYRKSRRTPSNEAIEMLAGKYKVQQMPPPYECGPPLGPFPESPSGTFTLQERPSEEGEGDGPIDATYLRSAGTAGPVTDGRQERESLEERRRREAVAVYGERWAAKVKRIQRESPHGRRAGWALRCVIVKSGDDCRQELLALQLIRNFGDIFREAGLPLWVRHYEVLVTSNKTALIEMVPNTLSIHTIKSRSPSGTSLSDHFFAKFGKSGTPGCTAAQRRFTESLAAYSLICYILQIKDRHNGNILMDDDGHIVHIDFGFLLSNSPGGVNFESAPFKLTRELLEVMDSNSEGRPSEMFDYFKVLMIQGFLALRKHADRIMLLVRMMAKSGFPCFKAGDRTVKALEKRLQLPLSEVQCVAHVLQLIAESLDAWRTRQYDYYQRVLNGIL
ncbi:hypothetical protein GPECTOR_39g485 [Gonium pectorale]|uniref:1-phosphatidylinositol 4-kinase n=1 Tax=Gonium pectorale TaxID=33097 RepID=A0A150GAW8_GONPE|nr:hypothetical protein GPECTOR_39g485 [Gonium pectorale]|eukprot:KXZ46991.1 hypothetical protein GPECTOR_39g485 [Gonium pectorale]